MTWIARCSRACRGLRAATWLFCVAIVTTHAAFGQTPQPCERAVLTLTEAASLLRVDEKEIVRLAEKKELPSRLIGSSWRFNCAALMAWLEGDGKRIPDAVPPDSPTLIPAPDLAEVTATGTTRQAATTPSATTPPTGQDKPVGEAPEERTAEDVFLRGQRVLLGRREVVLDFGQFYSRSDDHLLAPVNGGAALATMEQQTFTSVLLARIGLLKETELFAGTTFSRQENYQVLGGTNISSTRRNDFGDVSLGVRRTLFRETAGRPDLIVSLNGSIPTADTPYAVGGGLVLVKSVDPVVLFANGGYTRALDRGGSNMSSFFPKNRVDASVGYGLALNDTLAISMAVAGAFTGTTTLDNTRLRQSSIFGVRVGLTSWLARGLYIEPSVSFGLTGPGRSFAFGVTMPYAFHASRKR